jgi:hypothetical protein
MSLEMNGEFRWKVTVMMVAVLALVFGGCATEVQERRVMQPATRTELSMRAVPGDGWQSFLAEVVTAKFPSGVTVLEANGQWRGQDGKVYHEPSRMVVVVHPSSREANRALEEIRREFKARFGEEVLRSDTPAMVSF